MSLLRMYFPYTWSGLNMTCLAVGPSFLCAPAVYLVFSTVFRVNWIYLLILGKINYIFILSCFISCELTCTFDGKLIKCACVIHSLDANNAVPKLSWNYESNATSVSWSLPFIWMKHHMESKNCVFKKSHVFLKGAVSLCIYLIRYVAPEWNARLPLATPDTLPVLEHLLFLICALPEFVFHDKCCKETYHTFLPGSWCSCLQRRENNFLKLKQVHLNYMNIFHR